MKRRLTPYAFFKQHAGYSYGPEETPEQGRQRSARLLARAERKAADLGVTFEWREDDEPFQCACDDPKCESHEPHTAYVCLARTQDGDVFACLGAISFGPGRKPWGNPYQRVIEAELATEIPE